MYSDSVLAKNWRLCTVLAISACQINMQPAANRRLVARLSLLHKNCSRLDLTFFTVMFWAPGRSQVEKSTW
jgi:hypothetical protein